MGRYYVQFDPSIIGAAPEDRPVGLGSSMEIVDGLKLPASYIAPLEKARVVTRVKHNTALNTAGSPQQADLLQDSAGLKQLPMKGLSPIMRDQLPPPRFPPLRDIANTPLAAPAMKPIVQTEPGPFPCAGGGCTSGCGCNDCGHTDAPASAPSPVPDVMSFDDPVPCGNSSCANPRIWGRPEMAAGPQPTVVPWVSRYDNAQPGQPNPSPMQVVALDATHAPDTGIFAAVKKAVIAAVPKNQEEVIYFGAGVVAAWVLYKILK